MENLLLISSFFHRLHDFNGGIERHRKDCTKIDCRIYKEVQELYFVSVHFNKSNTCKQESHSVHVNTEEIIVQYTSRSLLDNTGGAKTIYRLKEDKVYAFAGIGFKRKSCVASACKFHIKAHPTERKARFRQ